MPPAPSSLGPTLETARLILRPPAVEDFEAWPLRGGPSSAALLTGAAGSLSACADPVPTWAEPGQTMRFACALEGESAMLAVSFSEDGRSVEMADQGETLKLD